MHHAVQGLHVHFQIGLQKPRCAKDIQIIEVHGQAAALVHVQGGGKFIDDVDDLGNQNAFAREIPGQHLVARLLEVIERAVVEHDQKLPLIRGADLGLEICLRRFVHRLFLLVARAGPPCRSGKHCSVRVTF